MVEDEFNSEVRSVLVCGGRTYDDRTQLFDYLDNLDNDSKITLIIQGGARGADTLARQWAMERDRACATYNADWERFGKAAGHVRNYHMLIQSKPDLVVAFSGGKGTANMVKLARDNGYVVEEVPD